MYGHKNLEVIHQDAFEWMKHEDENNPESVDLIITDPPYWSLDEHRKVGTTTRLGGNYHVDKRDEDKWFKTINEQQLLVVLNRLIGILKNNRYMYVMCDHIVLPTVLMWARDKRNMKLGGITYSKPIIWNKMAIGMGYHWRNQHEYLVLIKKGKRKLNNLGKGDVLEYKRLYGKQYYPTEKPVVLFEDIIENSSQEGEVVLDCFAGSGAVGEAALRLNRKAKLVDFSFTSQEYMKKRFESLNLQNE